MSISPQDKSKRLKSVISTSKDEDDDKTSKISHSHVTFNDVRLMSKYVTPWKAQASSKPKSSTKNELLKMKRRGSTVDKDSSHDISSSQDRSSSKDDSSSEAQSYHDDSWSFIGRMSSKYLPSLGQSQTTYSGVSWDPAVSDSFHTPMSPGSKIKSRQKSRVRLSFSNATFALYTRTNGTMAHEEIDKFMHLEEWWSPWDHVFSLISMSAGFGDVILFPQEAMKFGFFRYLFAYTVMVITYGFPLIFLESGLGQFCGRGLGSCWEFAKLYSGVGYGMILFSIPINIVNLNVSCGRVHSLFMFISKLLYGEENGGKNSTLEVIKQIENETSLTSDLATPVFLGWARMAAFLTSWFLVLLILLPKIKYRGRLITYLCIYSLGSVTVISFYFLKLPGALDGVRQVLTSDTTANIFDIDLWISASSQCFFSFNLLSGVHLTLASYNNFHNILISDIFTATLVDYLFSIVGIVFSFSILGNLEETSDFTIGRSSTYTQNSRNLHQTRIWRTIEESIHSRLFIYLQMAAIIANTLNMVGVAEVSITAFIDMTSRDRKDRLKVVLVYCGVVSLLSLPYLTKYNLALAQAHAYYIGPSSILYVGMWLNLAIIQVIGADKFVSLLECSVGWHQNPVYSNQWFKLWWQFVWAYFCPGISVVIVSLSIYRKIFVDEPPEVTWVKVVGILFWIVMAGLCLGTMTYHILTTQDIDGFKDRVDHLTTPTPEWGPIMPAKRYLMLIGMQDNEDEKKYTKPKTKTPISFEQLDMSDDIRRDRGTYIF